MIIHNLDLVCTVFLPDKTNSVLVIDSDAVLPGTISHVGGTTIISNCLTACVDSTLASLVVLPSAPCATNRTMPATAGGA